MKSDMSPPSISAPAEALWIRGELIRNMFQTVSQSQYSGMAAIPLFVTVLWADAPAGLVAWAVLAALVALVRWGILRRYARHAVAGSAREHRVFFDRYRWLWPLSGAVWGLTVALHFDRVPLESQFVCWLLLAAIGMFAVHTLSNHLPAMRAYLAGIALPALVIMGWRIGWERQFGAPAYQYWLVLLLLLCCYLLLRAGHWLHLTHRQNFRLQFRNVQLIESLTRQTKAALEVVAVKNRFLASAAHDLRQPVQALGLYADWLRAEPGLAHEIAPKIVESTKAVNALFDSLFDLVRLDSGKAPLNIAPVEIGPLLHELEVQYKPVATAKGLQLRLRVARGSGTVLSDRIMLQRIVGNLISNAVRYTNRGGVLLASRRNAGSCSIEVWDTGSGIPAEYQREIFQEFFKVPNHTGTNEGFGLGLSIVARLAHILGHPITLASRPGRGTVFRLLLVPTDPANAARRAALPQLASMP